MPPTGSDRLDAQGCDASVEFFPRDDRASTVRLLAMQERTLGWVWAAILLLAHAAIAAEDGAAARRVTLDDGAEVALTVQGSGPPLVFIHGWACNRNHWREQIPVFAADHTVVALDLPGHGESTGTRATWTVAQYGDDVAAVVRKLGLDHVVLVGHSMGGPVALEAARRLGSTVAGIVVVDTLQNVEMRMEGKQIDAVREAYRKDWAATCAMAVPRMFVPGADPELVEVGHRRHVRDASRGRGQVCSRASRRSTERRR